MVCTKQRVIHPGWLTLTYEDQSTAEWACYHCCVNCGAVIDGASFQSGPDSLLEHTAEKHKTGIFALELYRFRSAVHALETYYGLEIFEWPDKAVPKSSRTFAPSFSP